MAIDLPFVDELDAVVEAPASRVFCVLTRTTGRSFSGRFGQGFTAALGCEHRGVSYTVPPIVGQELNGFRVAEVDAPGSLVLEGRHRFARYRLAFSIEPMGETRSRLRATTHAAFPGVSGAAYRLLVIGSGAHAVIARRLLAGVAREAMRDPAPGSTK